MKIMVTGATGNVGRAAVNLRIASMAIAAAFLLVAMVAGYRYIGWPPVIIVGGSGTAAFVLWSLTCLRRPCRQRLCCRRSCLQSLDSRST